MSSSSENIHHCYLLKSLSSSAHYIGYTTNPHRRLSQHNGKIKGGAAETSRNQPWKFLAILSNLPNETNGLQMEWAWQHPRRSKVFRAAMRGRLASSREIMAKQIESDKSTEGYLRRLLILICESDYGKSEFSCNNELGIYFFEGDIQDMFHGLMREYSERQNRNADYSDESEDEESPFCCNLPSHVKTHFVKSVKDLPFYEKIRNERKRRRKSSIEPGDVTINNIAKQQDEDDSCVEVDTYSDEENNDIDRNVRMINNSLDYLDIDDTEIMKGHVARMSLGGLSIDSTSSASVIDLLDCNDEPVSFNTENMDIITPIKSKQSDMHVESPIDLISPDNNRRTSIPGEDADSDTTIDLCSP